MKIRLTGRAFGTSFGDDFCDLFEENFLKRNILIIDRTQWEFGYQISIWERNVGPVDFPRGTARWKVVLRAPAAHGVSSYEFITSSQIQVYVVFAPLGAYCVGGSRNRCS